MNPHRVRPQFKPILRKLWVALQQQGVPKDMRRLVLHCVHRALWSEWDASRVYQEIAYTKPHAAPVLFDIRARVGRWAPLPLYDTADAYRIHSLWNDKRLYWYWFLPE